MDVVEASRSRAERRREPARVGWGVLTVAGAAAFWCANLLISLTPVAAAYRSALSIRYLPMLLEAAVGGLLLAGVLALVVVRLGTRVPGGGPVRRALLLAACGLLLVTALVEVPAKLGADVDEPVRWFLVATGINTIRVLALGLAIGLVARAREPGRGGPPGATTKETTP